MTTIETSLHPTWIAVGVIASVAVFLFLLRRELREQSRLIRWSIMGLRAMLCGLVWWLIAQPRAVTVKEEAAPLTANLSIDVSESMLLADIGGRNTSRWKKGAAPSLLDEAITLTEAAKIRLNLSSKKLTVSGDKLATEIQQTLKILAQAKQKVESYGRAFSQERLTSSPVASIAATEKCLLEMDERQPVTALARSATLAAEAALGLRRLDVIRADTEPGNQNDEGVSRIKLVEQWMEKSVSQISQLAGGCDLHTYTFGNDLTPLPGDGKPTVSASNGSTTQLYKSLNQMAATVGKPGPQISFLITDGVDSAREKSGEFSAAVRTHPLIVLPIGDPDSRPDVSIDSVIGSSQVREKDIFVAVAQVSSHHSEPVTVKVNLRDEERVLATREISLNGDGSSERVELEWKATGIGTKNLKVEIEALPNEKTIFNNSRPLTTTVTKDKYRILLCDAFPRWETRYLQSLFRRDPSVDLSSIIFEPRHTYPGKEPAQPPALPLSLAPWQAFDIVILGDLNPTQLTLEHQKLLVEYVNRGGNLLILAGENSMPQAFVGTPLESLLPMSKVRPRDILGTFVISPPENLPINPMVRIAKTDTTTLWQSIFTAAPEYRISQWAKTKQSAQTLLVAKDIVSGATHDFLAVQRVGKGRVCFAAAPSFYHLRLRFGDRHHLRFWGQMIRGMCMSDFGFGEGMVKTRLDRQLWDRGSEVQGRVRLEDIKDVPIRNAEFTAILTRDGQPVARMQPTEDTARPGEYFLRFPGLLPGEYQLTYEGNQVEQLWNLDRQNRPDAPECRFQILDGYVSEERQFAIETPAFWDKVNKLPLGTTIHPQTLPLMLEAMNMQPEKISLNHNRSIWDSWLLLFAIIIISGIEWLLRRTHGLC